MKHILKVIVRTEIDTDPDTSYLGKYSMKSESDYAIDREERGDKERNEYRYFNPVWENYKGCSDEEIRKYCEQDYQRMEGLNHEHWCYLGITAEAKIQLTGDLMQTISSGGLWGIESDSQQSYFEEIKGDELNSLRKELEAVGFNQEEIDQAFKEKAEVEL